MPSATEKSLVWGDPLSQNFGRTSAPRLPQEVQSKSGSISASRTADLDVMAALVIAAIDQHVADARCVRQINMTGKSAKCCQTSSSHSGVDCSARACCILTLSGPIAAWHGGRLVTRSGLVRDAQRRTRWPIKAAFPQGRILGTFAQCSESNWTLKNARLICHKPLRRIFGTKLLSDPSGVSGARERNINRRH